LWGINELIICMWKLGGWYENKSEIYFKIQIYISVKNITFTNEILCGDIKTLEGGL
jgi:hypothetical protein